jgi:hypothetical protein
MHPVFSNKDVTLRIASRIPAPCFGSLNLNFWQFSLQQARDLALTMQVSSEFHSLIRHMLQKLRKELENWARWMVRIRKDELEDLECEWYAEAPWMRKIKCHSSQGYITCGYIWISVEIRRQGVRDNHLLRACLMANYWCPLFTKMFPELAGANTKP